MKIVEMRACLCYTYLKEAYFMEFLLYIPAVVFVVMMIYVIQTAIRFGENRPSLTKAASIVGIIAGIISVASSIVRVVYFRRGFGGFIATVFCLVFAFALKYIVRFFEEDYDKKHQIPVNPDDSAYRFMSEDFLDENARFNGEFKNYDDID